MDQDQSVIQPLYDKSTTNIGHTLDSQSLNQSKKLNTQTKAALKSKQEKTEEVLIEDQGAVKCVEHRKQSKVTVNRNARLRGEEYIGVGGRIVPGKLMGLPWKCRMKCNQKIDEAARRKLHNNFWKMSHWEPRKQYT